MTKDDDKRAAELLHLRPQGLQKGDPVALPITPSTMFHLPGRPTGTPVYLRTNNPTAESVEHALTHLEMAETRVFPSGMAAISAAIFAVLKAGDRILIPSDGYYTTRLLADRVLARLGIDVTTRPTAGFEVGGFDGFALVFIETPSNPGLDVCDLAAICAAVRAAGGVSIVDNTTLTALGQRPLDLGADVVVASDTKAPGGHSDVLFGHVSTRDAAILEAVTEWRTVSGAVTGPFEAWQMHRSLESFEVRYQRMCNSAEAIAPRLQGHPALVSLRYPGLSQDPSHAVAARQQARFGFLISMDFGSEARAEAFIDACPYLVPATSFGGVHSSAERRVRWGDKVGEGFVRLSVGTEPTEELSAALIAALDTVA